MPEVLIVFIGVVLRLSMWKTYDVGWGYDAGSHLPYIDWFARHTWSLPPLSLSRAAYHPPLYYFIAGTLHALGLGWQALAGISVLCGIGKLGVIWWACERFLSSRLARLTALSLAAVLPSTMQLEGMVTNEGLSNLLSVLAMVVVLRLFVVEGRLGLALGLGLLLGLEVLTKVSGLALVGAVGLAALWELAWKPRHVKAFLAGLVVLSATVGPYVVHNLRQHGRPFLSGYDGNDADQAQVALQTPYLSRRPAAYVVGWTLSIYHSPYFPAGTVPQPRFFPSLLASTFVDAYHSGFSSPPRPGQPAVLANYQPLRPAALTFGRASVVGGTWIAAMTCAAWLVVWVGALRRRDIGLMAVLLCPLLALVGQLHFATAYPIDFEGPVKGVYMQFAAPPLFLLFGAAVDFCWRHGWPGRIAALSSLLALGLVASYTLYARLITPFTIY